MDRKAPRLSSVHSSGVSVVRQGLRIGDEIVPLHAGAVHYWHLDPEDWPAALEETKKLGCKLIDLYVPWGVHEMSPGMLDLGETNPRLNVGRFLELIHELGLYAIVRPGPHINAELTFFGIPERIIWDPLCQARSPQQNPVMLPMVPVSFPVPSYASETFLREVDRWFELIGRALTPHAYPHGPVVLLQIDNEGSLYFRDGVYDQDYRPEAVEQFRSFIGRKYPTAEALQATYQKPELTFATVDPPVRLSADSMEALPPHLDWAEFQEHLLAGALERMAKALAQAGLSQLPTVHNFPMGQEATPLNAKLVGGALDMIGFDYYHRASPRDHALIARRTTELVSRADGLSQPPFASEMGAGFPPFFPVMEESDSAFTVLTALAYGLRGFNVYMAVERDRWIGAPIDMRGRRRPFADFWQRLFHALDTVSLHKLRRLSPVRLLIPRSQQRLARVLHAFHPMPPALFAVAGIGVRESCLEDTLGGDQSGILAAEQFLRSFEQALGSMGVPYSYVGGESADVALNGARWVICSHMGGLEPELVDVLRSSHEGGLHVTLGPGLPQRGGNLLPLAEPFPLTQLDVPELSPPLGLHPVVAERLVFEAVQKLALPTLLVDSSEVFATLHESEHGNPKVLFLINPTRAPKHVRVEAPSRPCHLVDLLDHSEWRGTSSGVEVDLPPQAVRMLKIESS